MVLAPGLCSQKDQQPNPTQPNPWRPADLSARSTTVISHLLLLNPARAPSSHSVPISIPARCPLLLSPPVSSPDITSHHLKHGPGCKDHHRHRRPDRPLRCVAHNPGLNTDRPTLSPSLIPTHPPAAGEPRCYHACTMRKRTQLLGSYMHALTHAPTPRTSFNPAISSPTIPRSRGMLNCPPGPPGLRQVSS
jgi:hypothetical protein